VLESSFSRSAARVQVPFLTYSSRRDLREKVFSTWARRGELNQDARDNRRLAIEILKLRVEQVFDPLQRINAPSQVEKSG
jgi:hypothetical protein